jgi:hypothetical protein
MLSGSRLESIVDETPHELLLVSHATENWTGQHLDALLESIEQSDHAIGRRPIGLVGGLGRWAVSIPRRVWLAVAVVDFDSPCRLHRTSAIRPMALQSQGPSLSLEILAKATYLSQIVDEVPVPWIGRGAAPMSLGPDTRLWIREPRFRRGAV